MSVIEPGAERRTPQPRTPLPPQMALRVAVLGIAAFVLFGIVFFRLWYLQVLSGDHYLRQSQVNKVRTEHIGAPRGQILDRNGTTLVENRQANIVTLDPQRVPDVEKQVAARWGRAQSEAEDAYSAASTDRLRNIRRLQARGVKKRVAYRRYSAPKERHIAIPGIPTAGLRSYFRRLGRIVGLKPSTIQERLVIGLYQTPYAPVKIKFGVHDDVRDYLLERPEEFPGVTPTQAYVRRYPHGKLAAQVFGTIGQISEREIKTGEFTGAPQGTIVGQNGLERRYDQVLRGRDGIQRFLVDAQGNRKAAGHETQPVTGRTLKLTLDMGLQQTAQKAIAGVSSNPGAFVAMNPETGSIYALGSTPTFDPNVFSQALTQKQYDQIFGKAAGSPQFNRAITGGYPTGSIFKPITSIAALSSGALGSPGDIIDSPSCVKISTINPCNAENKDFGPVNLPTALEESADTFFYKLGAKMNNPSRQNPIQKWAHKLGLGQTTGVDLPGEFGGTVPDPAYRKRLTVKENACRRKHGISTSLAVGAQEAAAKGCGITDRRPWSIGDNVNLSTGQGDLQATPLQMATVYATLANGGKVVTPHIGASEDDPQGRPLQTIKPRAARRVKIPGNALQAIRDGLLAATSDSAGTSYKVFHGAGWNESRFPVYGKTGTAQRPPYQDQSWFVCWSFDRDKKYPPIVIATTVENAGFGADVAAPAAKVMLAHWFQRDNQKAIVQSTSTTR